MLHLLAVIVFVMVPSLTWAQTWPNQPTGSTLLTDNNLSALPSGPGSFVNGWTSRYNCNVYPNVGNPMNDGSAPLSPPNGLHYEWTHNKGFGDSCVMEYYLPAGTTSVYFGTKVKISNPYDGWLVNHQKILLLDPTRNHMYITMFRPSGGSPPRQVYVPGGFIATQGVNNCHIAGGAGCDFFNCNINCPTISLGVWHTLEAYYKASTCPTCQNGVLRYYWDGVMVANYTTVNTRFSDHQVVIAHPVWDAFETSCPNCVDHQWHDHFRVAIGGTPTGGGIVTPNPQCSDGVDNDGDGKIDMADPGCSSPSDTNEADDPVTPPTAPSDLRFGWLAPLKELWPWLSAVLG